MINKKGKHFHKTLPKLILAVVVIAVLAGGAYKINTRNSGVPQTDNNTIDGINFNPPTEEELQQAEDNKQDIVNGQNQQAPTTDPESGKKLVKPLITYAGQYGESVEVGGFVPGIIEINGTCTLTLRKGEETKEVSVDAVNNASTTDCPVMIINKNELSSGTWTAKVSYSSITSSGVSESRELEVK